MRYMQFFPNREKIGRKMECNVFGLLLGKEKKTWLCMRENVLCVRRKYQQGLYLNYDVDELNFHLWLVF